MTKRFVPRLNEELDIQPNAYVRRGDVDVERNPVRDMINIYLAQALIVAHLTPYHAMERIRKVLNTFHILIPAPFLEGQHGFQVFPVRQFGNVIGMTNDGEVKTKVTSPYSVFFQYKMTPFGTFKCSCKIMDATELASVLTTAQGELA